MEFHSLSCGYNLAQPFFHWATFIQGHLPDTNNQWLSFSEAYTFHNSSPGKVRKFECIYRQTPKSPISCLSMYDLSHNSRSSILLCYGWANAKTNPGFFPIYSLGNYWWLMRIWHCEVRCLDRFDWKWQNRSIERDWGDQKPQLTVFCFPAHLLFITLDQS